MCMDCYAELLRVLATLRPENVGKATRLVNAWCRRRKLHVLAVQEKFEFAQTKFVKKERKEAGQKAIKYAFAMAAASLMALYVGDRIPSLAEHIDIFIRSWKFFC